MQTSSGSDERPTDNADDSSAARPAPVDSLASGAIDDEDSQSMEVPPQDSVFDDESDSDADLHVVVQRYHNSAAQPIIDERRILLLSVL